MSTWTPLNTIIVAMTVLPIMAGCIVSIVFAFRGNAVASQAALDALHKSGIPNQLAGLQSQVQQLSLLTPSPVQPQPNLQPPPNQGVKS